MLDYCVAWKNMALSKCYLTKAIHRTITLYARHSCCHTIKLLWKGRTSVRKNNEKPAFRRFLQTPGDSYRQLQMLLFCTLACKKHYTTYVMIVHLLWCLTKLNGKLRINTGSSYCISYQGIYRIKAERRNLPRQSAYKNICIIDWGLLCLRLFKSGYVNHVLPVLNIVTTNRHLWTSPAVFLSTIVYIFDL